MTTFEIISIVFNIGSLILVGIGIYQLNLTKKDINLREKRESTLLAGSLCEKFLEITNEYDVFESDLRKTMKEKGLYELKNHKYPLNKKQLCNNYLKKNKDLKSIFDFFFEEEYEKNRSNQIIDFLNKLESIAIYFNEGIASKKVAFNIIGNSYCSTIELFMPAILYFRCTDCGDCAWSKKESDFKVDYYSGLLNLYIDWKSQI